MIHGCPNCAPGIACDRCSGPRMNLVFVYGSLKRGRHNNWLLEGADYLGEDVSPPLFTMISLGGYPGVTPGGTTAIRGEVFNVSDEMLKQLDRLEGHPSYYERVSMVTDQGRRVQWYLLPASYTESNLYKVVHSGNW